MKIKISEVDLNDGVPLHEGKEIDLSAPFHQLFDLESENLQFIMFKELYLTSPTCKFMRRMVYTQCLASLLKLEIWEDKTIMDEVKDSFFITMTENITRLFGFSTVKRNPYSIHYSDHDKLKQEPDGSYTLDNIVCVESYGRTTHYFRNFLLLNQAAEEGVNGLLINTWEGLIDKFKNHQFISYLFHSAEEQPLTDRFSKLVKEYDTYDAIYNLFLSEMLTDNEEDKKKVQKIMYLAGQWVPEMPNYHNRYFDVVELKAIKLKEPKLLFTELMKTDNEEDLVRGLLKLGFKIIR